MARSCVFERLTNALVAHARDLLGDDLVALAVFGSYGRGTATHASDLDVLVVLRERPRGRRAFMERFAEIEEALRASLAPEHLPELSPVVRSLEDVRRGFPLMLDMVEDAKILYDPQGALAAALRRLEERLKELGALRIPYRGAWYWDLKPDYRPGEVFEL